MLKYQVGVRSLTFYGNRDVEQNINEETYTPKAVSYVWELEEKGRVLEGE